MPELEQPATNFEGLPRTRWIPRWQCYRITAVYYTPSGSIAALVIVIGFTVLWAIAGVEGLRTGELTPVKFILCTLLSCVYGLGAQALLCPTRDRIEISKKTIRFGKNRYDATLPHRFDAVPSPTRWFPQTTAITFRMGDHPAEILTVDDEKQARQLLERLQAVDHTVQQSNNPCLERISAP